MTHPTLTPKEAFTRLSGPGAPSELNLNGFVYTLDGPQMSPSWYWYVTAVNEDFTTSFFPNDKERDDLSATNPRSYDGTEGWDAFDI